MSNDLVLREAGQRQVTCIVRERQLRLYGHVARLSAVDPAHRILCCRDPRGCTMPKGLSRASCLRQVESYPKDMEMIDDCLVDGQTGIEGAPSQGQRGDTLLRRMPP